MTQKSRKRAKRWLLWIGLLSLAGTGYAAGSGGATALATGGSAGVVLGALIATFLDASDDKRSLAYRVIRSGQKTDVLALLAKRKMPTSPLGALFAPRDELGLCALEIAAGDLDSATQRLLTLPKRLTSKQSHALARLRAQLGLASGQADAHQAAFELLCKFPRAEDDEFEAFTAYLVARHVVQSDQVLPPALRERYLGDEFLDVRAYGQWVRLHDNEEVGPLDRFAELARAGALAKSADLTDLAAKLEARAAQVAGASIQGPYRG